MATQSEGKTIPVETAGGTQARAPAGSSGEHAPAPLHSLRREVDRLFEDFESGFGRMPWAFGRRLFDMEPFRRFEREAATGLPAVDMTETAEAYKISAEMPGLEEKDVEITLADDLITLRGEHREEKEEEEKDYHLSERRYGSFQRAFRLPPSVDRDRISAELRNGVLTVTLPKTAEAQQATRKIEVKSA